jgi:hypothetical protein
MAKTAIQYVGIGGGTGTGLIVAPGSITIDGWFRMQPPAPGNPRVLFFYVSSQAPYPMLFNVALINFADGRIQFASCDWETMEFWTIETPGPGYADGKWHHIEANITGNVGRVFIDGHKVVQDTMRFRPHPDDRAIFVHHNWLFGGLVEPVALDDLRISDIVRHEDDFVPEPKPHPLDANTRAYWHFDEGTGNIARDAVPGGIVLQLDPAPDWVAGIVEEVITMPTVVSHVKLIYQMLPTGGPERIAEHWAKQLKNAALDVNQRRKSRIPDGERFIQRLAGPAAKAWRNMLNPAFKSRAGLDATDITANHAANLQEAFLKYNGQLDFLFETVDGVPAKRFLDLVQRGKQDYLAGVARRTLPLTGCKIEGRGISALAALWLTKDPITEGEIRAADEIIEGGPYKICEDSKKAGLKAMLTQRLTQAGATIVKSGFDAAVMTKQNQLTAEQVQGFVDTTLTLEPFTAGGGSHVDFIYVAGVFYLEIKVSKM